MSNLKTADEIFHSYAQHFRFDWGFSDWKEAMVPAIQHALDQTTKKKDAEREDLDELIEALGDKLNDLIDRNREQQKIIEQLKHHNDLR